MGIVIIICCSSTSVSRRVAGTLLYTHTYVCSQNNDKLYEINFHSKLMKIERDDLLESRT